MLQQHAQLLLTNGDATSDLKHPLYANDCQVHPQLPCARHSIGARDAQNAAPASSEEPEAVTTPNSPSSAGSETDDSDTNQLQVGLGQEFEIFLDRRDGSSLGIDVTHTDGCTFLVEHITLGLVRNHNIAKPTLRVMKGDRFVEVNGIRGNVPAMLDECRKPQELRIVVLRPKCGEFSIKLHKGDGQKLGIDVDHTDGRNLRIENIYQGLVMDWNQAHPDREVRVGDCIVDVNGEIGLKPMVLQCVESADLHIQLYRRIGCMTRSRLAAMEVLARRRREGTHSSELFAQVPRMQNRPGVPAPAPEHKQSKLPQMRSDGESVFISMEPDMATNTVEETRTRRDEGTLNLDAIDVSFYEP